MSGLQALLEQKLQDLIPHHKENIVIGDFLLSENEALFNYISSHFPETKDFVPLQNFYSYFTKTYKKPIKVEFEYQQATDTITKELVYSLYKEHNENKLYNQKYGQYIKKATKQRDIIADHGNDYQSYIKYIGKTIPMSFFANKRPHALPHKTKGHHAYIVGASGYGKSETIKLLVHHYLTQDNGSVILFDPHGDLAKSVAQFKENLHSDRLVYIKPRLNTACVPKFNPFTLPQIEDKALLWDAVNDMSEQFLEVMEEVFATQGLTENMRLVLKNCFIVLTYMPNTSVMDVLYFLDKDNKRYIDFANTNITNPITLLFLKQLHTQSMESTKEAIKNRFFSLLQHQTFANMTSDEPSFDLETLINQGKLIVFDFEGMGQLQKNIFGKLLISQIRIIGQKRDTIQENQRLPCRVFIDECQLFITKSIKDGFQQLRKYKVFFTLAQQNVGDGMSSDLEKAVLTNSQLKIIGKNTKGDLKIISENINVPLEELQSLSQGEFYIASGENIPIRTKIASHLVNGKNSMNAEEWETLLQKQVKQYYKAVATPTADDIAQISSKITERKSGYDRKPLFSE